MAANLKYSRPVINECVMVDFLAILNFLCRLFRAEHQTDRFLGSLTNATLKPFVVSIVDRTAVRLIGSSGVFFVKTFS